MTPNTDTIIEYTKLAILFFFSVSILGIFLLFIIKSTIHRYFYVLNHQKDIWSKRLKALDSKKILSIEPPPKTLKDIKGFAMAIAQKEIVTPLEYRRACLLIRQYSIDSKLVQAYQSTYFKYRKAFLLSLLADLPCNREQEFCKDIIFGKNSEDFYHFAIYALSKSVIDINEAQEFLEILSQTASENHLGTHYSQLLIFTILKHLSIQKRYSLVEKLLKSDIDILIIKYIVEALGRFQNRELKDILLMIYNHHCKNPEIVSRTIRSFFLCKIQSCNFIKDVIVRQEIPIKIVCAKFGLDICSSEDIFIKLIYYFFDKNYYVRRNIFQACLRHRVEQDKIIYIVNTNFPEKSSDKFFQDMMSIYDIQRITFK